MAAMEGLSNRLRDLAPILIELDSFGQASGGGGAVRRTQAPSASPQSRLVRVYLAEREIPVGNPLDQPATITLRIRRLSLPSDWMVSVRPSQLILAPGEQRVVTLTVGAGTAAPQGIQPSVALEAYERDTLLGGVEVDTVVPNQWPPQTRVPRQHWTLYR
jgi:hypothetical protein